MTAEDALTRLGESTAEAATGVLSMFAADQVVSGQTALVGDGADAFESLTVPAVGTSVAYVDGVTGGNVFVMTPLGARRLAAAMMGSPPPEDGDETEISELELSAVAEAMNQMMAAAAGATSAVLGTEVEIGPPETAVFTTVEAAREAFGTSTHANTTSFTVCGEKCRLVQLVPNAFVVRMTQALDELTADYAPEGPAGGTEPGAVAELLRVTEVRVWAELGRARMASARAVGLPHGAVVELDRDADDPVDVFVNGVRMATGRLEVVGDAEWAVRIETVFPRRDLSPASPTPPNAEGGAI